MTYPETYEEYEREIDILLVSVRLTLGYAVHVNKPLPVSQLKELYDAMCRLTELLMEDADMETMQ